MVGRDAIKLLVCGAILLGWTWDSNEGDLAFKAYAGHTFTNSLTNVKNPGPNHGNPNYSDLRLANGPAVGVAIDWFIRDWLSLRLDGQYHTNAIKQQGYVSCTPDACASWMTKGWNGKALTLAPSLVAHSPSWHGLSSYAGVGPSLTFSSLGDQKGSTESTDLGLHLLGGLEYRLTGAWAVFAEYHHKSDYLDCNDMEGCFRGRRYGNMLVFGLSWTLR